MAEIDFQDILDDMTVSDKPADPIQSIYKIIPQFDSCQISIMFQASYFIEKWGLEDLRALFNDISVLMKDNKSLGFMSSKTLKDLLAAYTQNEMIRGVSVRSNPNDKDANQGIM